MLILRNKIINRPVLSLRSGGRVATATTPIINPDNLKIEGIYCQDSLGKEQKILLIQDIRDLMGKGIVINDYEVLAEEEDLIRLKPIIKIGFDPMGKPVQTENKKRLGKVVDYALDNTSLYIQKLYISQSLLKKLGGTLSIDRSQVVEVTDKKIIIKDPLQPLRAEEALQTATTVPETLTPA